MNQNEVFSGELGDFYGRDFYAMGGFYQLDEVGEPLLKNFALKVEVPTTNETTIHAWDIQQYRSAKYVVQITQGVSYQTSELLAVQDDTVAYGTEYAVVETNGSIGVLSVAVVAGYAVLQITLNNAPATVRISGMLIPI